MPSNWLAVGAETHPLTRARELRRSWERLLADGALGLELPPAATAGLRPTIVESWRRSLATGLDPTDVLAPIEADESEVLDRWFAHPLGSLPHVLSEQLRTLAQESRSVVVVTDATGLVLHRVGDERLKHRAAEMNLFEGARYSEAADGTNGIGTALAADHAFQVFAFEHFNERHHEWVCSGAPVHDPVSGRTIGLIDVSSLWKIAHPRSLELVATAAQTTEQFLLEARRDRDARLRRRYCDLMMRSTDLLVSRDGYVLAGAEQPQPELLDVPEGGGEVGLGDGSVAVAEPLGQGEAYLVRRPSARGARSAPAESFERAARHVRELVTEQAALRQVATLVARESSPDQLFTVVAKQVARIFDIPHVRLVRYEPDGSVVVGGFSELDDGTFPIGSRWPLDSPGVIASVRQTGRPARVGEYANMPGQVAAAAVRTGMRSAVGSPIVVAGRLWGAMVALCPRPEPLPEDTEGRLTDFTELLAAAIASAESRVALGRLVDEQAALRRVATLVAEGEAQATIFSAVCQEVGHLLGADITGMLRFPGDGTATSVAFWSTGGPTVPVGAQVPLGPDSIAARILATGAPARRDTYAGVGREVGELADVLGQESSVGAPIRVGGRVWGALMAATRDRAPWAAEAEGRLAAFTELVGTAIGNAESRDALTELAEEQAALRRVATLVAQGVPPEAIFSAVGEEIGRLFGSSVATVGRFLPDAQALVIVGVGPGRAVIPVGSRWELDDALPSAIVHQTGHPVRVDDRDWSVIGGPVAEVGKRLSVVSTVASPIFVAGRLWGVVTVSHDEHLPWAAEGRLEKFTDLIATAIGNADSSAELAASRRRIVTAADEARRRIERDLHDGIQQRLIALSFRVRAMLRRPAEELPGSVAELSKGLKEVSDELREVARGIHPTILGEAGLGPALRALARRSSVPIDVDVRLEQRLPAAVEAAAYYIASEALTNVAKHAQADVVELAAALDEGVLTLVVRDNGVGGVDAGRGSGILGLTDRVEALGGTISIASPPRGGTAVSVRLPTLA